MTPHRSLLLRIALALGYIFLYGPIVSLIVYSFNASRLVTVWAGFSTRWYGELLQNQAIQSAAATSLEIAVSAATCAVVLGTAAGFALARHPRFRTRPLFVFMVTAPLVMPEVMTGLSLLLLFVALEDWIGWPAGRGLDTIILAHATFCMTFVAIIVQARLASFDRSLEEAALDLGARPWKVLVAITLPIIAPALATGWLLSFTLSLDDLVITSFVSGPSSTTLPMVIFSSVRLGVSPQINALATIFVVLVAILVSLASWLNVRRSQGRIVPEAAE
ncbi:MAG: ABC transporter permease subunit [Alphaproteobacteria bacterium]|nr:ABC transporter permease subunit [Alphaproteobacteria bacterium]